MSVETVLVTGAAGFIGPKVVEHLLQTGYRVVVLDKLTYAARVENGRPLSLEMVLDALNEEARNRYSFVQWDISDSPLPLKYLMEVEKVDYLIHMAAESHVDRSTEGNPEFIQTEIYGTYNVLQALREQNASGGHEVKRAVFVSTDETYGSIERIAGYEKEKWYDLSDKKVSNLIKKYQFTEATSLGGGSPYAACKGGADLLVGSYFNTFELPVVITRGVNNFGPFQHPEKLIPMAICTLLMPEVFGDKKRYIPIYDRGLAVREWLTTKDYARAIVFVMHNGEIGEVYNVGSGNRCRNRDLLLAIFRACQRHIPPEAGFKRLSDATFNASVARPGHDLCYAVNCEKLLHLGWQPEDAQDFEERVKDVVGWYVENRAWWEPLWTNPNDFIPYWNKKYRAILEAGGGPFDFYTPGQEQQGLNLAML